MKKVKGFGEFEELSLSSPAPPPKHQQQVKASKQSQLTNTQKQEETRRQHLEHTFPEERGAGGLEDILHQNKWTDEKSVEKLKLRFLTDIDCCRQDVEGHRVDLGGCKCSIICSTACRHVLERHIMVAPWNKSGSHEHHHSFGSTTTEVLCGIRPCRGRWVGGW